ncbi:MAE_28990/MAE_18760 family HEPN-like nuclease [Priestia aryabhattai]|uniref:MAE_28990/MAE_18760 family HEPN-like nuclease n=1 Tax=Priestia aryabhattai TaxID=412384 RepID=UPI002E1EC9DE|nr:MAE_28990/MAE_18760 family HEPN-like nuclease [Priestia aryabhattai]
MASSNLERLQDRLNNQLTWRKKELTILQSQIEDASGETLNTLLRSGITLLYAHWEGYIKMAAREYLRYLNNLECKLVDLKQNFVVLHHKKAIIGVRASNNTTSFGTLFEKITNQEQCFKVKEHDNDIITTESNLKFKVLVEILYSLGLPKQSFELKKPFIDIKLLDKRNKISHGEYVDLCNGNEESAKEEFKELYHVILELMDEFKEKIIEAGLHQAYLKAN